MGSRLAAALALGLFVAPTAAALEASVTRPSDRSCLLTWNSPLNHASRLRLLAARPIRLSLLPGVVGTDSLSSGSAPTQTSAQACILTIDKSGTVQIVTGLWRNGHVSHWSFGHSIPTTTRALFANVRLLPDGRVTKIYLH